MSEQAVVLVTPREAEVLDLLLTGASTAAIARQLVIVAKTVEAHVQSCLDKAEIYASPDLDRRVALAMWWLKRRGLSSRCRSVGIHHAAVYGDYWVVPIGEIA